MEYWVHALDHGGQYAMTATLRLSADGSLPKLN
jgi:hypothetical protein